MDETKTGTDDNIYNLISVLYHTLQGAQTHEKYLRDADGAGDDELAGFLKELQQDDRKRGDRAKTLLASRLGHR